MWQLVFEQPGMLQAEQMPGAHPSPYLMEPESGYGVWEPLISNQF